jgi:hypothetical protein
MLILVSIVSILSRMRLKIISNETVVFIPNLLWNCWFIPDNYLDFISNELRFYLNWDPFIHLNPLIEMVSLISILSRMRLVIISNETVVFIPNLLWNFWFIPDNYLDFISNELRFYLNWDPFIHLNPHIEMVSLISILSRMRLKIISNETVIIIPNHLRNFWIGPYFYLIFLSIGMRFIPNEIGFFHLNRDKYIHFCMGFISILSRLYLNWGKIFLSILSQTFEIKMR